MINVKKSILAIALLSVSNFAALSMEEDKKKHVLPKTPHVPVVAISLDPPARHPGGLYKQDQKSGHWMVQCQASGCGSWLKSTQTPFEPPEKIMLPTDPQMTRFHMLTCKGKSPNPMPQTPLYSEPTRQTHGNFHQPFAPISVSEYDHDDDGFFEDYPDTRSKEEKKYDEEVYDFGKRNKLYKREDGSDPRSSDDEDNSN